MKRGRESGLLNSIAYQIISNSGSWRQRSLRPRRRVRSPETLLVGGRTCYRRTRLSTLQSWRFTWPSPAAADRLTGSLTADYSQSLQFVARHSELCVARIKAPPCRIWVKMRKTRSEYNESASH